MKDQPWILGISASHNGSACLLKGDEIVVAIQEERLTRFKRDRIYGARPSHAVTYCLSYAGIKLSDLSLVVLCIQGRANDEIHDIRRDPFLNVVLHGTPTITIPHHYGHAVNVFATSGALGQRSIRCDPRSRDTRRSVSARYRTGLLRVRG